MQPNAILPTANTHRLSATNTYANAHAQVYVLPKALTALTLT